MSMPPVPNHEVGGFNCLEFKISDHQTGYLASQNQTHSVSNWVLGKSFGSGFTSATASASLAPAIAQAINANMNESKLDSLRGVSVDAIYTDTSSHVTHIHLSLRIPSLLTNSSKKHSLYTT